MNSQARLMGYGLYRACTLYLVHMMVLLRVLAAQETDGFVLRWVGDPSRGLATFEGVEDDRANSHPAAKPHIKVVDSTFRFDMHMVDRDGSDRQRHEVKGINNPGEGNIKLLQGETWRFVYDMYIPNTLTGGSRFTHIYQQKMVSNAGSSGGPVITLSTTSGNNLLPRVVGGFSSIPLSRVWDKWIEITFEHKFDLSSRGGYARWVVRDVATGSVLTDQRRNGNLWANEGSSDRRVRPKWGIYRSLGSSGLKDCYLVLKNMRAYQKDAPTGVRPLPVIRAPGFRRIFAGIVSNGTLTVPDNLTSGKRSIALYEPAGKRVYSAVLAPNEPLLKASSAIADGVYFIHLTPIP